MANLNPLSQHLSRVLQAKANAYIQGLIVTPMNAETLEDTEAYRLSVETRLVLSGSELCNYCQKVDFSITLGDSDEAGHYDLGFVQEILSTIDCALCRLVTASLRMNWSAPPIFTRGGDLVRCHLFAPGPKYGNGRREMVIAPLVDEEGLPEEVKQLCSRQSMLLLADDLGLVNADTADKSSIVGRRITPQCDTNFFQSIFRNCVDHHGVQCEWFKFSTVPEWAKRQVTRVQAKSYARKLRVIDVEEERITIPPLECEYVALSYVWGGSSFLRLLKDNEKELASHGALKGQIVPRTVREAMKLVKLIGERYLWVDALCIIQDDDQDKIIQISQMDIIYSSALLTIVAASGVDAEAGLPGLESGSRQVAQHIETINGVRIAANGPRILSLMKQLRWNTRGWTFQEMALSKRVLCFTPGQCYYLCNKGVQSEDTVLERPAAPYRQFEELPPEFDLNTRAGLWQCYKEIVQLYCTRDFTWENDVNDGVDGLLNSLSTFDDESFICGLPETLLDVALLWMPNGPLRRRSKHRDGEDFPSWSWTGWVGAVFYPHYLSTPQEIQTEITDWAIVIQEEQHKLFVDSKYIRKNTPNGSWPQNEREVTQFTPSPWRRALREKHSTNTTSGKNIEQPQQSIDPLRSGIQTGVLSFTAPLASFIIYNSPDFHPALADGTNVQSTRRPCAILHESRARRNRPKVVSWVGTVYLELSEAQSLPLVVQGHFIVLSSTNTKMQPFWPQDGKVYNEERFGPLPSGNQVHEENEQKAQLYNVMWIDWGLEYSSRRGIGQIHRDGWELADSLARKIKLK